MLRQAKARRDKGGKEPKRGRFHLAAFVAIGLDGPRRADACRISQAGQQESARTKNTEEEVIPFIENRSAHQDELTAVHDVCCGRRGVGMPLDEPETELAVRGAAPAACAFCGAIEAAFLMSSSTYSRCFFRGPKGGQQQADPATQRLAPFPRTLVALAWLNLIQPAYIRSLAASSTRSALEPRLA
ncbi:uncharacterized protein PSFLO_00269 [Pseudozyma flocculosa]|uniref:Uncharacterized protein n=1 Tax=Pseudozyma flocculosa TaxID=84751 RepID=A0A5C3ERE8_9BASI|nr:uncharacterized protein PSFLO_00269 [Pseudozyma flocculosa]